jgi:hypothetical protein
MGDTTVAYIDKGFADGLSVGHQLDIYEQLTYRDRGSWGQTILLPPEKRGRILVLHTEKNTATVLITQSIKELGPGALLGTLGP